MTISRMKILTATTAIILMCGTFTVTAIAGEEETADVKIARAVSAAPASISDDATVMDVDGTILRQGTNGWICLPGVGLIPGDKHPMCNDAVWMAWMKAAGAQEPFTTDVIGFSYMLQGDALVNNENPAETDHSKGNWVQEGPHLMLLMPKEVAKNLPRTPDANGPYVMWGDTPLVHVMVPVGPREK